AFALKVGPHVQVLALVVRAELLEQEAAGAAQRDAGALRNALQAGRVVPAFRPTAAAGKLAGACSEGDLARGEADDIFGGRRRKGGRNWAVAVAFSAMGAARCYGRWHCCLLLATRHWTVASRSGVA